MHLIIMMSSISYTLAISVVVKLNKRDCCLNVYDTDPKSEEFLNTYNSRG